MADDDKKRRAQQALVDRVLHGDGQADAGLRARAYNDYDLPPSLHTLIGKVAQDPVQVTDADFAAAKAAGFTEDQLFELVVCAAVGQSARRYDAGLAALAEATGPEATRPEATGPEATRPEATGPEATGEADDAS